MVTNRMRQKLLRMSPQWNRALRPQRPAWSLRPTLFQVSQRRAHGLGEARAPPLKILVPKSSPRERRQHTILWATLVSTVNRTRLVTHILVGSQRRSRQLAPPEALWLETQELLRLIPRDSSETPSLRSPRVQKERAERWPHHGLREEEEACHQSLYVGVLIIQHDRLFGPLRLPQLMEAAPTLQERQSIQVFLVAMDHPVQRMPPQLVRMQLRSRLLGLPPQWCGAPRLRATHCACRRGSPEHPVAPGQRVPEALRPGLAQRRRSALQEALS